MPLLILISIAIKMDSKGPILFRQVRLGKDNRKFTIFKFRTMYNNTEAYALSPSNADDKRVTKVGKFLRHTSLDELPNLINVFTGKMSLIGPRAIDEKQFNLRKENCIANNPDMEEYYNELFSKRHKIRPGITGLTQIKGRSNITVEKSIEYDIEYVDKSSLFYDIKILIMTFVSVIARKGVN